MAAADEKSVIFWRKVWEIHCYDRSIIDQAAKISELSPDFIEKNGQHVSNDFFLDVAMTSKIYKAQANVIR